MRPAKCEYFGKCGGCAAQHIEYPVQLDNKRQTLAKSINYENIQVFSDNEFGYRNRMDLHFHASGLGFRKVGDWKVIVPVKKCEISNTRLNELLKEVDNFFIGKIDPFDVVKRSGTFRYAIIRTPYDDSAIMFVLNKDSTRLGESSVLIEDFAKKTTAKNILINYLEAKSGSGFSEEYITVKGTDQLRARPMGKTITFSVLGFYQNNDVMAEKMLRRTHDLLAKYNTKNAYLLDLYGGVGTFGIMNADLFSGVTIVESVAPCIESAKRNIAENGITNAEAIVMDAKHLKKLDLKTPLYVINDPPRSGMDPKTIEQLQKLQPEVIIYVSCNVQQLGKDIPKFKGYSIKSAALFDLFPQTNHAEAIVELVKAKKSVIS
jgi:23S rRNA (uracil-5-)-methyltransferase RumA